MPDQQPPDMIQQAGELLRLFQLGMPLSDGTHGQDDSAIVQASAVLAVAAELRDLRTEHQHLLSRKEPL